MLFRSKEAYQAVIDNPPKLKVPDSDTDLPVGAIRTLNGVIYTNRPPLKPVSFKPDINREATSNSEMKVMCIIVDKK